MIIKTFKSINGEGPTELDSTNTLIFCFFSSNKKEEILNLKKNFPFSTVVGCSSAGEIHNKEVFDDSIVVSLMKFETTSFKVTAQGAPELAQSFELGKSLYKNLDQADLKTIFVLSNGLNVNGAQLAEGCRFSNKDIPIVGGLAGDGTAFKETLVFNNGVFEDGVIGVGLYGKDLKVFHGTGGGWVSFGPKRHVTKSKANVLYELDGKPALALYKEYLGEESKNLPASGLLFPLSISYKNVVNLTRTILSVNEEEQSITFAGDIPQGAEVKLMHADYSQLIDASREAAGCIGSKNGKNDYLAVAVSCVGRRLVLGEYVDYEISELYEGINNLKNLVGFYSYGEICPTNDYNCELHNQTMTLFTFSEALDECA